MILEHSINDIDLRVHVLKTLLYFDIFNYPLKSKEVFHFLGTNSITEDDVRNALDGLANEILIYRFDNLYSLHPNETNIKRRVKGNNEAEKCLLVAQKKAKLISRFPFVRGVLASGSLSKGYMDEKSDIDFFIITVPGRLWIARTLLVLYKRIFLGGSRKYFCVNYFVDEDHLEIEEKNLFTATELATLLPLHGSEQYSRLIESNDWLNGFFPNFVSRPTKNVPKSNVSTFKKILEALINACFAANIESYFKRLTIDRWKKIFETQYSKADFDVAFKSKSYASKHHPQHFQRKVMEIYAEKLKLFNFSSVVRNNRAHPMDKGVHKGEIRNL